MKSKTTAALLALFLGGLGVHKFYLGKTGIGVIYLIFCWTYIPAIVGMIEGFMFLAQSKAEFYSKYGIQDFSSYNEGQEEPHLQYSIESTIIQPERSKPSSLIGHVSSQPIKKKMAATSKKTIKRNGNQQVNSNF